MEYKGGKERMQQSPEPERKLTLLQIRERHGLSILDVAWESNLPTIVVWRAFVNRTGIRLGQAKNIIHGVNALAHTHYTLRDIDIKIAE